MNTLLVIANSHYSFRRELTYLLKDSLVDMYWCIVDLNLVIYDVFRDLSSFIFMGLFDPSVSTLNIFDGRYIDDWLFSALKLSDKHLVTKQISYILRSIFREEDSCYVTPSDGCVSTVIALLKLKGFREAAVLLDIAYTYKIRVYDTISNI